MAMALEIVSAIPLVTGMAEVQAVVKGPVTSAETVRAMPEAQGIIVKKASERVVVMAVEMGKEEWKLIDTLQEVRRQIH